MTKKIGVLTFHNAINYGAVLQAYALEKYLENQGINAELIGYKNPHVFRAPSLKGIWKGKNLVRNIYYTLEFPFWYKRYKKFQAFLEGININDKCSKEEWEEYSSIIVGSDQVWNLNTTNGDFTYYLDSVENVKKYSYASSFGTGSLDEKYHAQIRKNLKEFDMISVRENSGKKFINTLLPDKEVEVVLDPTFLLDKKQWKEILEKPRCKERYILIYQLAYSKPLIEYAERLAREKRCKLVTINGNPRQPIHGVNIMDAGPTEWLGLFEGAEMVMTNSFHGTVFSIIFQKDFYTALLTKQAERNDRVLTLLTHLGLENRILEDGMDLSKMCEGIDYSSIEKKLNEMIERSYNYLDKVLNI